MTLYVRYVGLINRMGYGYLKRGLIAALLHLARLQ